jgi:hypothetical protein
MFVCCECCVLSGSLCDELITPPEESYRLWCIVVCDLETSRMRRPWHALGRSATAKKKMCDKLVSFWLQVPWEFMWNCDSVNIIWWAECQKCSQIWKFLFAQALNN